MGAFRDATLHSWFFWTVLVLRGCSQTGLAEDILRCALGWGNRQQNERVVPAEWINDGYCDCPLDGKDEPQTEACSGATIGGWPGIPAEKER